MKKKKIESLELALGQLRILQYDLMVVQHSLSMPHVKKNKDLHTSQSFDFVDSHLESVLDQVNMVEEGILEALH